MDVLQCYGVGVEVLSSQYYDAVKAKGHSYATRFWKHRKVNITTKKCSNGIN